MSPRSFWSIVIKLFGVYILSESIIILPQLLTSILLFSAHGLDNSDGIIFNIGALAITIITYMLFLWCCIFKTDWAIDILKLDKGFPDERFELNMHRSAILKIAIIIIGGLIFIDSFPLLCRNIFAYFKDDDRFITFKQNPNSGYVVLFFIKSVIGYFMLTCSRMIVNYLELKRKKADKVG